ncbi:MAG: ankyrin repeat domain-containing protein [Bryobacteraceae bacterium]
MKGFSLALLQIALVAVFAARVAEAQAPPAPGSAANLLRAATQGDLQHVKELLAAGADVNAGSSSGETPLHNAVYSGNVALVELLLASGADVNAKERSGSTPLHVAAQRGYKEVAEVLLAHKASVDAKNNVGTAPLQFAAQEGQKEVAQVLISHKADINAKSNDGQRPLHAAALNGHTDLVSLLLANGAEVNAKEDHGLTALHDAVGHGFASTVKVLLASKADANAVTSNGLTPLDYAAAMGGKAVAELLLASGADINAKPSGHTALEYAQDSHHDDVVALLGQPAASPPAKVPQTIAQTKAPQTKASAPAAGGAALVITFPNSDNPEATALKALHDISPQYAAYTAARPHTQITLRELSVTVFNHQHKFSGGWAGSPGTVGTRELTKEQIASETQQITAAVRDYMSQKARVLAAANYGLIVELFDDDGIFFDNNQNPRGAVSARLLFIDTVSKQLLWFSDKPGGLSGVFDSAVKAASNDIKDKLKPVLGDK